MQSITYQLPLRPALPEVCGCKDYREERELLIRIDDILTRSGLEQEFIAVSMKHRSFDREEHTARQADTFKSSCVLVLRSNIARRLKKLDHREFCARLADSHLLQWFLQIGEAKGVTAFAKSSSHRHSQWIDDASLSAINSKLFAQLANNSQGDLSGEIGLAEPISFDNVYFDSTCLKAPIHFPVDWVLLRDIVRTLMKATVLIRETGLRHRMPQEPLAFLSDMNTLCMKMSAKFRTKDGKKHRKQVLREMKKLTQRIERHARNHLKILIERGDETGLGAGEITQIKERIEGILIQVKPAIKQAHERIIGGRKLPNSEKILSLYDPDVQVIKRGKSGAEVEFGNNLWLGETREGLIVDYRLEAEKISDAKAVAPAIERLVVEQGLPVKNVWGDRGLHSAENENTLEKHGIRSGLCPRDVGELDRRLQEEPGMREGLKRRAGTEARISIIIRDFMGKPALAKGIENRQLMVGWAVLTHNLWVLARLKQKTCSQQELKAA